MMKISQLAEQLNATLVGDSQVEIHSVASLSQAEQGELAFLTDSKYLHQLKTTKASVVLVPKEVTENDAADIPLLQVDDVHQALDSVLEIFAPEDDSIQPGVHPSAQIHPSVTMGENVSIAANVVISEGVSIGDRTVLMPGVFLGRNVSLGKDCTIGVNCAILHNCHLLDRVSIYSNTTIGSDGFGYRVVNGSHKKIPHIGSVIIENDVEIGANCAIDRAKFGKTRIGSGTKIDNLVHMAHNVQIGPNCLITAQVGIAGTATLGQYTVVGGQAGIGDHIKVGDFAMVAGQCGVDRDVAPKAKVAGKPPRPLNTYLREQLLLSKLPDMAKDLKQIKKQIEKSATTKNNS